MIEKEINTNTKGNIALGKAISYFTEQNYTISIPLNDSQWYDLIIEKEGIFQTVQVKYTSEKHYDNSYSCSLRTTSGTSRKKLYSVVETPVDFLFCYCDNGWAFNIPVKEIKNKTTISLFEEKSKYANKDILDVSIYKIN